MHSASPALLCLHQSVPPFRLAALGLLFLLVVPAMFSLHCAAQEEETAEFAAASSLAVAICQQFPALESCQQQQQPAMAAAAPMEKRKSAYMRFGKRKSAYMRFGKRAAPSFGLIDNDNGLEMMEQAEGQRQQMEKRKSAYMRFGKRKSAYMRFGRK